RPHPKIRVGTQFYRGFVVILTDLILRSKYLMGLVITPHGSSGYDFLRVVRSTKANACRFWDGFKILS
ncbi:hypothetical protein, partial [Leptospira noguchii]|uniref:hypothetical protein n=1 Tax=Leptospira noguchii TaxID=28182 RepID=UPI001E4718E1